MNPSIPSQPHSKRPPASPKQHSAQSKRAPTPPRHTSVQPQRKRAETRIHVHCGHHHSLSEKPNGWHKILLLLAPECAGTLMWCASDDHADVHADTKAKHKTGPILEAAAGTQPHRSLASQHMNPPCQHVSLAGQHVLFIEKRTSIALCFDSPAPIVAIHFSSEFLAEFMLDAAWSGVFARPWYELLKVDTRIGALFECARELCQHQRQRQAAQPLGRGALKGRAQLSSHYIHALGVMLAALLLNAQSVPQPGGKSAGLTPEQLKKAQAYIEAHFTESFRITALYRFVGLSERRFGRLFKNSTGMLPRRYILARRVTYAQELLRTGHLRIAEVANAAGFADQSHMRHCFRLLCSAEPPRRKRLQPA